MRSFPPTRIVCLTEETVETLYLLGESERIVGVTGYAVRPKRVRAEKPRVGAFTSADVPKILDLDPDLVLLFSDLQGEIARDLMAAGVAVHGFNQRDIAGIFAMIRTLGALVDARDAADALIADYTARLNDARADAEAADRRPPRVYFEEWDDPMISGIGWVSELIAAAGGRDVFADRAREGGARDRIVRGEDVINAAPDVIIGSWCGKKVRTDAIASRAGWADIPAVRAGAIHEVKSPLILQPGPAALTDGLDAIRTALSGGGPDRRSVSNEG